MQEAIIKLLEDNGYEYINTQGGYWINQSQTLNDNRSAKEQHISPKNLNPLKFFFDKYVTDKGDIKEAISCIESNVLEYTVYPFDESMSFEENIEHHLIEKIQSVNNK